MADLRFTSSYSSQLLYLVGGLFHGPADVDENTFEQTELIDLFQ